MALILADRVKETSTTTGNGVFTLAGAATGFQSFAIVGNGNTTFYCIAGQGTSEWEVGIGTYASAGTTLTRTTVLSNSSATEPSALSFAAGTKDVFVTYPSEKSVNLDASGNATALGTPVAFTGTNITGTATSFTASNVTTNANLTGVITSSGNATSITSQTGTGTTFVVDTSPILVTPNLGTPSAGTLTNCTFPTLNQDTTGTAAKTNALNSATTVVNVSSATAPTVGQYLIATSSTAATWQTPAAPAPFAATTAMIFKQTAAPTGWTKVLTNDNSALRVVTGTAGTGGSVAFTTAFASKAVTGTNAASGAYTLATADIPSHTHPYVGQTANSASGNFAGNQGGADTTKTTSATGGGGSHSHSAAAFTGTAINLAVAYVDVIVATKD